MLLASKVAQGIATDEEIRRYNEVFRFYEKEAEKLLEQSGNSDAQQDERTKVGNQIWQRIEAQMDVVRMTRRRRMDQWYFKVAAVLILVAIPTWIFFLKPTSEQQPAEVSDLNIVPGGNKAVLTLPDGSQISLDDAAYGSLVDGEGVRVRKSSDGEIIYEFSSAESEHASEEGKSSIYHQVETPRGGQFQVVLPDGSRVYLNAASSLRYPAVFSEEERRVELEGEAYFEVASRPNQPFVVKSKHQNIKVLGTKFNVNAYLDNAHTVTTLMEGSVQVSLSNGRGATLQPGEQSTVHEKEGRLMITSVNPESYLAWKEGLFHFDGEPIRDIMKRVGRWYDTDITFAEELPDEKFYGVISRFEHVDEVLHILKQTNIVDFEVKGRRIYVMKNDRKELP